MPFSSLLYSCVHACVLLSKLFDRDVNGAAGWLSPQRPQNAPHISQTYDVHQIVASLLHCYQSMRRNHGGERGLQYAKKYGHSHFQETEDGEDANKQVFLRRCVFLSIRYSRCPDCSEDCWPGLWQHDACSTRP